MSDFEPVDLGQDAYTRATHLRHVLSREDAAQFTAALDTPQKPTKRARAGAKAYANRVVDSE